MNDDNVITETKSLNKLEEQIETLCDSPPELSQKKDDDLYYARYSDPQKRFFVFIVSMSCLLSPLSSLAFLPAVSEIAARFDTTGTIINVSNAVYCVVMAVAPCLLGPWGDIYGRKFTFLVCLTLYSICSILVAVSQNLAMFFVFRSLTALYGTVFFSVGSSIIGDIYRPEERGGAMGWLLAGSQIGPAFGPVMGGIIVTYTSWRVIFWVLAGLGVVNLVLAFVFLKETGRVNKYQIARKETGKRLIWIPYNPFKVILAFRYKNLVCAGMISVSLHYNMYTLLTPIRYVVDPRFHLNKPIFGSLFYLAPGMGYLVGSFMGGKWADRYVKKYIKLRGFRVPEDRLRSTYIAHGLVLPSSILIYGWCLKYERGGKAVPIIAMFCGGVAQTICFPSVNAYCVDSMPHLGGDAVAGNYVIRFVAAAIAAATVLIQIEHIGVGWTCTISAFVLWIGFAANLTLIKFGAKMREGK